jgi:ABC-type lipopolysaccharide export system ATPase subunit
MAVDGVDLSIAAGTVFGLLGPNGAGKTTTVSILATLVIPDEGQASVHGYDVITQAHRVRQLIGLTGQYASVDETLTGMENLVLIGRLTGASRKDAHDARLAAGVLEGQPDHAARRRDPRPHDRRPGRGARGRIGVPRLRARAACARSVRVVRPTPRPGP